MKAGPAALRLSALSAGYGRADSASTVLHGIDLEVPAGSIGVLLGANGAGKTTTLRAISGMIRRRGSVLVDGQETVADGAEAIVRRGVAHVPQGRGTFTTLSVQDNLRLGAYLRTDRDIDADMERCYGWFPVLHERRRLPAGGLSGGEQQMLAVSRALMLRPRLLLLDEPSLGLAPAVVDDLFAILADINGTLGTTMLVVEQNAEVVLRIADRAAVLESGRVVASGPAADLARDPAVRRAYLGV